MRYHDFHLKGYAATKFGTDILLELLYDYPGQPVGTSWIHFSDVEAYHFIHTGGAIITEIMVSDTGEKQNSGKQKVEIGKFSDKNAIFVTR